MAAAAGVRAAAEIGATHVQIASLGSSEPAAEGAVLANWSYQALKSEKKPRPEILPLGSSESAAEGAVLANWSYQALKSEKKPRPEILPMDGATNDEGWKLGHIQA